MSENIFKKIISKQIISRNNIDDVLFANSVCFQNEKVELEQSGCVCV